MYYLLHSYDICKVFYRMGGGVRQSIGYKDVRKMVMFLPPFDEQQSIIAYLDEQCAKIDSFTANLNEEIALFTEYRTRLISDVVTGKVDVRDLDVPEYVDVPEYEVVAERAEVEIVDEVEVMEGTDER